MPFSSNPGLKMQQLAIIRAVGQFEGYGLHTIHKLHKITWALSRDTPFKLTHYHNPGLLAQKSCSSCSNQDFNGCGQPAWTRHTRIPSVSSLADGYW